MHYTLIACEVLYRELCQTVARSPHQVDLTFLPKGLHDIGSAGMASRVQQAIDAVEEGRSDAILLGYALCNYGIVGLTPRHTPLVVPRGHDCITLFLGSQQRYLSCFQENPGTYFLTSGWIERGEPTGELRQLSIQAQSGMDLTYEQLVEKYGEENAAYLYEQLGNQTKHYRQILYIRMGVEPDGPFRAQAQERAATHGLEFRELDGEMGLIESLVNGPWDPDRFLVVKPGERIVMTHDERIIATEPVPG
jgi:hypothetical protein